jgi:hypothetical protein
MRVLGPEQIQHFLVVGLGKGFIVSADGLKIRIGDDSEDGVSDVLQIHNRGCGTYRHRDAHLPRTLPSRRQDGSFHGRSRRQTIVDNEHNSVAEIQFLRLMKFFAILRQAFLFLPDDFGKFRPQRLVGIDYFFVEQDNVIFGEGSHGEFAMLRVADFSHHENFEWAMHHMRHFRRHDHASAGQADNNIHIDALVQQVASKLLPRILARCEHHGTPIVRFEKKSTGEVL